MRNAITKIVAELSTRLRSSFTRKPSNCTTLDLPVSLGCGLDQRRSVATWGCTCKLLLDAARQFVLPFRRNKRVVSSCVQIPMPGDLRSLNCAPADLLPPRDVRATERVRAESRE